MERWRLSYSGRVQGVGFRATCRSIARTFDVSGWVRNEHDGTVTLEAQGKRDELTRFTQAIETRLLNNIADVQRSTIACDESTESGFEIRR